MLRQGSPATSNPCERRAQRAIKEADTTPIVGAKLEIVVRTVLLKKTDLRSFLSTVETVNVVVAQTKVNKAFVKVDDVEEKVRATSETASTTKIALIKVENISSVNRVRY